MAVVFCSLFGCEGQLESRRIYAGVCGSTGDAAWLLLRIRHQLQSVGAVVLTGDAYAARRERDLVSESITTRHADAVSDGYRLFAGSGFQLPANQYIGSRPFGGPDSLARNCDGSLHCIS